MNQWLRGTSMLSLVSLIAVLSACDAFRGAGGRTEFNGDSALAYTRAVVAFGPRVPGTQGHRRAGDWIARMMRARADTVIEQTWTHVTKDGRRLPMRNIIARFRPADRQRVLYVTHWDTRPTADNELNLGAKREPIPGANDGGSGVGLFLALADVLKKTPPKTGVDLLFVDGEDYGDFNDYDPDAASNDVLIGSSWFANYPPDPGYRPLFGVLWDMIGDKDLNIEQEQHSVDNAPEVVARVWQTAAELGYEKYFLPQVYGPITDDHLPLIRKGMRVVNVIDIQYGPPNGGGVDPDYHHTLQDTIDKVSAKSLGVVGDVALTLLRRM